MEILSTLAPVFMIIGLGAVLRRAGALSPEALRTMTWLAYWIGLPALLFVNVATAEFELARAGRVFAVLALGTWACIPIAYAAAPFLKLPRESLGTFVMTAFRSNLSFIGLPVLVYASEALDPAATNQLKTVAILAMTPMMAVSSPLAVFILLVSRHRLSRATAKPIAIQVIRNPLLIACAAGLIYSGSGLALPVSLGRSLEALAEMALPLALIAIGGTLADPGKSPHRAAIWTSSLIRVGVAPLLGILLASWFGLAPKETETALIMLACPVAVASYPIVVQLGGDEGIASRTIVLSTVLSAIPFAIILAIF